MTFAWPLALLTLLVVPLLAGSYVREVRRRRRRTVRYSSVALLRAAAPPRRAWRRHVPAGLLLAALAALGLAAGRPQAGLDVPLSRSAVIVALDVSGSMCSTDVVPNRLTAAQDAVREFVRAQGADVRVGLVLFSGFAQVAVAPTTDREPLLRAIDGATTGRGTTIGSAILKSVDAISEIDPAVRPSGGDPPSPAGPPRQPGTFAPEIVVLLTDGANTRGVDPADAARVAADRGVRVYPIGFGTHNPSAMVCSAAQLGGSDGVGSGGPRFGGGGGGGAGGNFLIADEPTLRAVARTTGGQYFAASDAGRLQAVLRDLPQTVATQHRDVELTAGLAGLAAVLVLAGGWAAARWTPFPS